jgi:hypothetical protein
MGFNPWYGGPISLFSSSRPFRGNGTGGGRNAQQSCDGHACAGATPYRLCVFIPFYSFSFLTGDLGDRIPIRGDAGESIRPAAVPAPLKGLENETGISSPRVETRGYVPAPTRGASPTLPDEIRPEYLCAPHRLPSSTSSGSASETEFSTGSRRRPPVREERPFPARCGSAWPQP